MTLEEAIKILSELHDQCCQADSIFCTDTTGARCEAVDMAISVLQAQEVKYSTESSLTQKVLDTISRRAAIDTLDKHLRMTDVPVSYPGIISALTEWLNELPSVQSEPCEDDKGCSNCMYSGRPTYKSPCSECRDYSQWERGPISRSHENSTECEDAVSRTELLHIFEENCYPVHYDHNSIDVGMTLPGIVEVLNIATSVTPKRKE